MSRILSRTIAVTCASDGWKPSDDALFRKEVAYCDKFVKIDDESGEVEFELEITEKLIDHWVATFSRMQAAGIEVPVPIGHTDQPEARRGTVVRLTKEQNPARDKPSLYMYVSFTDEEAAKQLTNSQVSLYMPPKFYDGRGEEYIRPIRHVCITDYPVIPGLEPFGIAASHRTTNSQPLFFSERPMANRAFKQIAASRALARRRARMLSNEMPEDEEVLEDEEDEDELLEEGFEDDLEELEDEEDEDEELLEEGFEDELPEEDLEDEEDEDELPEEGFEDDLEELEDEEEEEEEEDYEGMTPSDELDEMRPMSHTSLRRALRSTRHAQLSLLIREGRISPAAARVLKKHLLSSGVAMSRGGKDPWEAVFAALSKMPRAFLVTERTGPQVTGDRINPLIADAARRAASQKR